MIKAIDAVLPVRTELDAWNERDNWIKTQFYTIFAHPIHKIEVLDGNGCRTINGHVYHDDYCSCEGDDEN